MDLNTLIATIVTATAALIAIIGGFLVSRVITLSSEQNSIRRRLREIKLNIETKEHLLEGLERNLLIEDQEDFINDYYCELIFDGVPLAVLLEHDGEPYRGRKISELEPVVDELLQVNSELKDMFRQQDILYSTDLPEEFSDFTTSDSLTLNHRKYWYELLYDEHRSRMDERPQPVSGLFNSNIYGPGLRAISPPDRFSATMRTQEIVRAYNQKRQDRDTFRNDINYLQKQEKEHQEILKDYAKPRGMWGGLIVLIYASVVGIVYPVMLLPYPENTYNDIATKELILGLFFSQLVLLFGYLAINMYLLTKDEK